MLARIQSCAVFGIDAFALAVEVDTQPGMFKIEVVGLPDTAVKESRDRVWSAIKNSGYRAPRGRTLVNLAPADIRKEGSALDLPIAIGMLAATDQMAGAEFQDYMLAGELALDGSVRPVAGASVTIPFSRSTACTLHNGRSNVCQNAQVKCILLRRTWRCRTPSAVASPFRQLICGSKHSVLRAREGSQSAGLMYSARPVRVKTEEDRVRLFNHLLEQIAARRRMGISSQRFLSVRMSHRTYT